VNIGSRTKGTNTIPGVKEYTILTRPISELLNKIEIEETNLKQIKNINTGEYIRISIVGGGAAAVELATNIYCRWSKYWNVKVVIIS
jgi:NADH dehydrogenase FAD-containing subunit